jgi:KaiC/GvpD/RAD55 family RecA-like ATPase
MPLLNWIELDDIFRLGMTVAKIRANPRARTTYECEITDGDGMRVPRPVAAK